MTILNEDGKVLVNPVTGDDFTGLYSNDRTINIVEDDTDYFGVRHPCGAFRVNTADGDKMYDDTGAIYFNKLFGVGAAYT